MGSTKNLLQWCAARTHYCKSNYTILSVIPQARQHGSNGSRGSQREKKFLHWTNTIFWTNLK